MGLIEDELSEVKKLCERRINGSRLVSCVPTMVRVEIKGTGIKHLVVCIQFPRDYPNYALLIELKSRTLSEKLLQGLTQITEQECKKHLGKPQILHALEFIKTFIDENPLSCCYDEISNIRKLLSDKNDEFKLKQKTSSILIRVSKGNYIFACKIAIPDNYPQKGIQLDNVETNFPNTIKLHMVAQAKEITRRCVEAPLKRNKNDPPFKPCPSLEKAVTFLITCIKYLPDEKCQYCKKQCLPQDPQLSQSNETAPNHVERVYCGHLFHLSCLQDYMRKPPFGNKRCQTCDKPIAHHKWSLSEKLAEDRWAHEQARERELNEVADFFK